MTKHTFVRRDVMKTSTVWGQNNLDGGNVSYHTGNGRVRSRTSDAIETTEVIT